MSSRPERIFLDTNVYIIGAAIADSDEAVILEWAGFGGSKTPGVEVVVSDALFRQIRAVARRLRHKDWAGEILMRIWRHLSVRYVLINPHQGAELAGPIPREDVEIFMAAREGEVDCFVSANRELVRAAAAETGAFDCFTPEAFVDRFLRER